MSAPRRAGAEPTRARLAAFAVGRRAESAAADYLVACGFEIVGANVRLGHLEIDLVARRGPLVAVVEVRTRGPGSFVGPLASIDAGKRERIYRAATRLWHSSLARDESIERVRIDVIAVTFEGGATLIEHIEAAITDG